jgi:hypothetical protein
MMRCASVSQSDKAVRSSPGKNLARVAVGIGAGVSIFTFGPVLAVSFCQLKAKEICATFVEP